MDKLKELFQSKVVGIFGLGIEGRASFDLVKLFDPKKIVLFDENASVERILDGEYRLGPFGQQEFSDLDIAIKSPGIKIEKIPLELKSKITTSTELFFDNFAGKILGITGTKGKSTTASLILEVYNKNNVDAFLGGNIGTALVDLIGEGDEKTVAICELSSFQLRDLSQSPHIGIVLPITGDHFDFHPSEDDYVTSKSAIARFMRPNDILISFQGENENRISRSSKANTKITFSLDDKTADYFIENGFLADRTGTKEIFGSLAACSKVNKIPIVNLVATAVLCDLMKLNFNFEADLVDFVKPRFRIEYHKNAGFNFYNDAASTNPISTIEALKTMDQDFVLIIGGRSKGVDMGALIDEMIKTPLLKRVYLIGESTDELKSILDRKQYRFELVSAGTLEAVFAELKSNDKIKTILFSPSFASFDQFKNYKERGERFNQLLKEL